MGRPRWFQPPPISKSSNPSSINVRVLDYGGLPIRSGVGSPVSVPCRFQKSNCALILKKRPTVIDSGFRYVAPYVC